MALRSRTAATLPGVLALSPACTSATTKPILKRAGRPSPLPLSPSPFPFSPGIAAMFNSVSARSPHVHFPPSPLLTSVMSIQSALSSSSAKAVEVGAQEVHAIPSSPFPFTTFRLADAPKPPKKAKKEVVLAKEKPTAAAAAAAVHFEDPRSPRPTSSMSLGAAALKLRRESKPRSATDLYKALTTFPRSPYPSAPAQEDVGGETGSSFPNDLISGGLPKRRLSASVAHRLSPVQEHPTGETTMTMTMTSPASALNNAFWQSLSLDLEGLPLSASDGGDFPESASSEVSLDIGKALTMLEPIRTPMLVTTRMSRLQPELLFADGNGNLWSPGLPKQQQQEQKPEVKRVMDVASGVGRSTLTAPSPKDPRAKFPSFSTAFGVVQTIRPPVRAHLA